MKIYSDFHDFFNKNESEMEPPSILPRKHKNSIIPQINGPFSVRNERLKSEVSQIISFVADKKSIPALINLLNDKEYDVRWIAAESLIKIGRKIIAIPEKKLIVCSRAFLPARNREHFII
jgi:HEAT repeat protein